MATTHIKLTTKDGFKLILSKKDLCVSIGPTGIPYVFNSTNSDDGWLVTEPLSYILDELGVDNG